MRALTVLLIFFIATGLKAQIPVGYLKEAAENNPLVQSKFEEFQAALQQIPQVNALPDPSLSIGYFIQPVETRVGPQIARVSLSQMFPWFGTLEAKKNVAALAAESKYQDFLDAKNQVVYNLQKAYYPLYELREKVRLQQENLKILETYYELSVSRFESGQGAMVDAVRVDIMQENIETEVAILQQKEVPLITAFNKILNRPAGEAVYVPDTLFIEVAELGLDPDTLLEGNPKLVALERKIEMAEARQKVAAKEGMPKLGVGLDYMIIGQRDDAMAVEDNGKNALMPMATISLPIYRKKYKAARQEAEYQQKSFAAMKESVQNTLFTQYQMARFEAQKAFEKAELYNTLVTKSEQALELLLTDYSTTGRNFEEVLRMQQDILKYQMALAEAKSSYFTAMAEVEYVLEDNKSDF